MNARVVDEEIYALKGRNGAVYQLFSLGIGAHVSPDRYGHASILFDLRTSPQKKLFIPGAADYSDTVLGQDLSY